MEPRIKFSWKKSPCVACYRGGGLFCWACGLLFGMYVTQTKQAYFLGGPNWQTDIPLACCHARASSKLTIYVYLLYSAPAGRHHLTQSPGAPIPICLSLLSMCGLGLCPFTEWVGLWSASRWSAVAWLRNSRRVSWSQSWRALLGGHQEVWCLAYPSGGSPFHRALCSLVVGRFGWPSHHHDSTPPRQHPLICTDTEPIHPFYGPPKVPATEAIPRNEVTFLPFSRGFQCELSLRASGSAVK